MGFEYVQKIPSVEEILQALPLNDDLKALKAERDQNIKAVFTGQSDKFLLIIGPCSADNEDAVCEYVTRLHQVQEQVKERIIIIPRIYTNKPRTTGEGYKGLAHQPDPMEDPDIVAGLKAMRKLHLRVVRETGLSAADEMLYPSNYTYMEDLLSYVAIGARSVENQKHRLTASGMEVPVGMKNPTSGDLTIMLNSIRAAQLPHIFIYNGWQVKTSGNPLAHCVLRGAVTQYGRSIPNYHYEDLMRLCDMYLNETYANPAVIIDTNHANSAKQYDQQPRIAMEVLHSMRQSTTLRNVIKGMMIESYLIEGSQKPGDKVYGKSITDPCMGWEQTKLLILELAEGLARL